MRIAHRTGMVLTLLLGMMVAVPIPTMATTSRQRPTAYRLLSEARQGDAVRSIARTIAASEAAQSSVPHAFEELGEGVAWLPMVQKNTCTEMTRTIRMVDPQAGTFEFDVQARCAVPLVPGKASCARYRIAIQGSAQAIPASGDGEEPSVAPEWQEVVMRGEGEMISCAGESVARAVSLGIERRVVLQPWASAPDAPSNTQRIDIAWAALP